MPDSRVATWNIQWCSPRARRAPAVRQLLGGLAADVLIVTEGRAELLPDDGHVVASEANYGYPLKPGRRKVLLWSRSPWTDVDQIGHPDMPSGRFVSGRTKTPIGTLTVVGVCIPWREAHVRTGRKDRKPWEDHLAYLDALGQTALPRERMVVAGDFNQRMPRKGQPKQVYDTLEATLRAQKLRLVTDGQVAGVEDQLIDHIALSADLHANVVEGWSRMSETGRMSDHDGVGLVVCPLA